VRPGWRVLPDHTPTLGDVSFEDFPSEAWDHLGRTADGRWRLRLRPGFLPQALEDLVPADPAGGQYVELHLTTSQLLDWERRWAARASEQARLLDELAAIQRERVGADVDASRRLAALDARRRDGPPTLEEIQHAIATLRDAGTISERTGMPTREQVANQIGVSEAVVKRVIAANKFPWPRAEPLNEPRASR
jgi:hypothetical protein